VEQKVTVIAIDGEHAVVQARRASACGDCAGKASCSTMGSWSERFAQLRVKNTIRAGVGDEVLLEVPDSMLLKVAFRLYGLPMIAFVAAGLVVRQLAMSAGWALPEVWGAFGGVLGVLGVYAALLYRSGRGGGVEQLDAHMVRITKHSPLIPIHPT